MPYLMQSSKSQVYVIIFSYLCSAKWEAMADNYLEKKMEAYRARQAAEQKARQAAWKKRMDAYRKKMQEQAAASADNDDAVE